MAAAARAAIITPVIPPKNRGLERAPECRLHGAVIEVLKEYKRRLNFLIHSDSMYVINCAQGKWKRIKNKEYWKQYDKYSKTKNIKWKWVKGHSGDKYNELVDKLAKNEVFGKN